MYRWLCGLFNLTVRTNAHILAPLLRIRFVVPVTWPSIYPVDTLKGYKIVIRSELLGIGSVIETGKRVGDEEGI